MCELLINGGNKLYGELTVQGSKNASLPILAATLLTEDECVLHNCPNIDDVKSAVDIIKELGCEADYNEANRVVRIKANNMRSTRIPKMLMEKMRSSVMFLGAILAKCGEAVICRPGGCRLGERPIDIHIDTLKRLGVKIKEKDECLICRLDKPCSNDVTLLYPSVGATENIMLLSVGRDIDVNIFNPAREPEIVDLQNFLNKMGGKISGAGTECISIAKNNSMHGCEYKIMPDRIVCASYACMTALCGGDVCLKGTDSSHMRILAEILLKTGCYIENENDYLRVASRDRLNSINEIKTLPYPGFPTDMQPLVTGMLTTAKGKTRIYETIFNNRFEYVNELLNLGADIRRYGSMIEITGKQYLHGGNLEAKDLRGGAALVEVALAADGLSSVCGMEYINRGYENIQENLLMLGADITNV